MEQTMELTFLVDNNSLIGAQFLSEPALSLYIVVDGKQILFDAGYSEAFMINARRKNIDLLHLDWVALSHGHFDHTWGLGFLLRHYYEAAEQNMDLTRPSLVVHPRALLSKRADNNPEIGSLLVEEKLDRHFDVVSTDQPVWLTESLVTLGEIERQFAFEAPRPIGERLESNGFVPDNLPDDTALAHVTETGLVVISGCAHAGICNTVEQARKVTGVDKVRAVLGGTHLLGAGQSRLNDTTDYLASLDLEGLWCCHCTDLDAKISMARKCPVKEVGSGITLKF